MKVSLQSLRILIIEDNPGDYILVKESLNETQLHCIEIAHARTIKQAIQLINENSYNLILLDLSLPDSAGIDSFFKLNPAKNKAAIIILTGQDDDKIASEALQHGAEDFLVKGQFDSQLLEKTLRHALERKIHQEAIITSEEKYKNLFENSPLPMWAFDTESLQIQMANNAVIDAFGYSREELINKNIFDFLPEKDHARLHETVNESKQQQGLFKSGEWTFICKGGDTREVEIIWHDINLLDKHLRLAVLHDITERKVNTQHLRLLEAAITYSKDSVLIAKQIGDNYTIFYINDAFKNLSGYSLEELLGKSPTVLEGLNTDPIKKKGVLEALNNKSAFEAEMLYYSKSGLEFWVQLNIFPVAVDQEDSTHFVFIIRDISEKKRFELFLSSSKERYDYITKATSVVVFDWNFISDQILWNENYKNLFGYNYLSRTSRSDWEKSIHPADLKKVNQGLSQVLKNQGNNFWSDEYRFIKSNGETAFVSAKGYIIYNEAGMPFRMVGALQDISERKVIEIEKDKMTSELIQRNKDLRQFAYIISHNLRAPLANIMGFTELIMEDDSELDRHQFHNELLRATKKLDGVIQDLNHILEIKGDVNEIRERVHLSALVEDITQSINRLIDKENVIIETNFEKAPDITTLKSYLQSIFYNIISNGIKYRKAHEAPIIKIRSWIENRIVIIEFTDNGIGINTDRWGEKLFGLYKRFHNHVEGKGMGLFMTKTQVEALGGEIKLSSKENHGTTITISLPNRQSENQNPKEK